jgi:hypothetical protein
MPKVVRKKPVPKKKKSSQKSVKSKPVKKTQAAQSVKKLPAQVKAVTYVKRITAKLPSRKK